MQFNGPERDDLIDVRSLNIAFLEYLSSPPGEQMRQDLPMSLQPVVVALTDRQIDRLAKVPFLLLTLSESDDAYWSRILTDCPVRDLFACGSADTDSIERIMSAALGFLWQLARRNPYATRLISGGSLRWCEQLASCTLLSVLRCAHLHQQLARPRLVDNAVFWQRLLGAGLSSDNDVRRAAHLASLQTMLIPVDVTPAQRFRTAACHTSVPVLKL
ncbi:MAG: hypothetical protein ACR2QT_05085 [Woeseiaceae bacterium]